MKFRVLAMQMALFTAVFATKTQALEFTALTYNIQARPILDRADLKIPQIAPLLDIYSVVGIQECFDKCHLLKHSKLPHQFIFDQKLPQKSTGSGLAMLTGFKVRYHKSINFKDAVKGSADYMASSGLHGF